MKILLSLSLSGTLLLFVILFLKQFYRKVFSRCWQYYILLFAALRFIIPVTFNNINITGYLYQKALNILKQDIVTESNITGLEDTKNAENIKETEYKKIQKEETGISFKEDKLKETDTTSNTGNTDKIQEIKNNSHKPVVTEYILKGAVYIYKNIFYIWLVFAIIFLTRAVTAYRSFLVYIKAPAQKVQDINILNLLAECEEKLGVKGKIELYCNPYISTPVLAGILKPCIIIPPEGLQKERLLYIFLHELVHYRHRDIIYKWFIQAVICIHWFNPFIHLLVREINRCCELSCDETVIKLLGYKERKEYGNTLLSFVKVKDTYKNPSGMVTLTEGAVQLKERLGAIMDFKKKSYVIKIATVIVTVIICFSFQISGVYAYPKKQATGNNSPKQDIENKNLKQENIKNVKNTKNLDKTKDTSLKGSKNYVNYYVQDGYYYDSYIFEIGWNLSKKAAKNYKNRADITLKDNSVAELYFDESVKEYSKDKKLIKAIKGFINTSGINNKHSLNNTPLVIERALIMTVIHIDENNIPDYAKKYYKNEDNIAFGALFPYLNKKEQEEYLSKMYKSGNVALFAKAIQYADKKIILMYIDKALKDDETGFLTITLDYVTKKDLNRYAMESYKAGDTGLFSVIIWHMPQTEIKKWLSKAKKDKKMDFVTVCRYAID